MEFKNRMVEMRTKGGQIHSGPCRKMRIDGMVGWRIALQNGDEKPVGYVLVAFDQVAEISFPAEPGDE